MEYPLMDERGWPMKIPKYTLPSPNITALERAIRIALAASLVGMLVAGTQRGLIGHDPGGVMLWALALAASLDLAISGAIGYCPLYHWIYFPWALREHEPRLSGPLDLQGNSQKRLGLLAFPGDGAAVALGLIVENAVRRYGPIPLWLDRALDIAPELGTELDYSRIATLIVDAAGSLTAAGVSAGDYLAIIKRDNMDVFVLAAAASRLGAVPALLSPTLCPDAIDALLERLGEPLVIADRAAIQRHRLLERGCDVVVVDGSMDGATCLKQLTSASPSPVNTRAPDDVAAITHTSGTTGTPKLCMHTGRSLAGQACVQLIAHKVFLTKRDVFATCPTAIHARVLSGWHALLAVGCGHLALFESDPETTATFFKRYRPTVVDTFPNVYIRWEQFAHGADGPLSNVRFFISTFDAVHPRTIQRLLRASKRRLPLWVQGYAQSEVGLATLSVRWRHRKLEPARDARDVGWAVPGLTRVRITDSVSGKRLRPGSVGQIEVGSVGQIAGYLGEEKRTASGWNGAWWRMGDVGQMTRWRTLRLHGRLVDAIPGLPDALAIEDQLLVRLPELTELVILPGMDGGLPIPVVCTAGDQPLDPVRWDKAMLDLPMLAQPIHRSWADLPTTATWKVKRSELMLQLQDQHGWSMRLTEGGSRT